MSIREDAGSIRLAPSEGFVVKTRILQGKDRHSPSTKVFINVCHDPQVPRPAILFDPAVVFPLIVKNEWEIPLIVSQEKSDKDKKGALSFVYDCCINDECFRWILVSADLKLILIEWCIESVELMYDVVLEREYSTPKMAKKGSLSPTEITREEIENGFQKSLQQLKQNDIQGLLMELEEPEPLDDSNEPLPDLLNPQNKSKPLIQEIGDLSIKPDADTTPSKEKTSPMKYVVSFTVRRGAEGDVMILQSEQFTNAISISHDASTRSIRLINHDETRILGKEDYLDFPAPDMQLDKVFMVEKEQSLYVFFHS